MWRSQVRASGSDHQDIRRFGAQHYCDLGSAAPPAAMKTLVEQRPTSSRLPGPVQETEYEVAAPAQLLPPADFRPFFTLVDDAETGEHVHPTVHYLFSDDDPEISTSAALEAIEDTAGDEGEFEERFVVVDMAANGKDIVNISSLSPQWQALKTTVAPAPSMGDAGPGGETGLMLQISGTDARIAADDGGRTAADAQQLVRLFEERVAMLDEVLQASRSAEVGLLEAT